MQEASVFIRNNVAEISLPANVDVTVRAKTNSKAPQRMTLKSKGGAVNLAFSGGGEKTILGESQVRFDSIATATFEFSDGSGAWKPSKLQSGGPYPIGNFNMLAVVAENGDDADYNDSILELSWYTPQGA